MTQDQPQFRIIDPPEQLPRASARVAEARAVEAVPTNSLITPLVRSGVGRGSIRERAVKGCVKNGKLRLGFAEKLPRHANAGEVARVVQRCERDAAFDRGFHISSHAPRFTKLSVDTEWDGRHKNDSEELESPKHMAQRWSGERKAETRIRLS